MDSTTCSGDGAGLPEKTHRLRAIKELETNLTFAQNRCGELKKQVKIIRSFYQKRRGNQGGDFIVEWDDEMNSLNSEFPSEIPGNEEDSKHVLTEESIVEGFKFERPSTGPQQVVQIIMSEMSQTVNCRSKEGKRTDNFMQTDEEIEFKSKSRRGKPARNVSKKGTKKKDEEKIKAAGKESDFGRGQVPSQKKKNPKKNKRRYSSVEVFSHQKTSDFTAGDHDCESNLAPDASVASKFPSPSSKSLTALPSSPSHDFTRAESPSNPRRNRSTTGSTTSYLLPTVASSMKRVYRPRRCDFYESRRIPFVVGKSLAKSHNLGTKIQETLSLMKRTGSLLSYAAGLSNDDRMLKSILSSQRPSSISLKTNLAFLSGYGPASGKMDVKDRALSLSKKSTEDTGKLDNQQLKSVLIVLHDEFSQLTKKYDELREQQKQSESDPEADALLSKLDEELNRKENEITVIMKLYNEVNELKSRLATIESLPSYRSYQTLGGPTMRHGQNASSENVKMAQLLRRIDQFQDKLKNYNLNKTYTSLD